MINEPVAFSDAAIVVINAWEGRPERDKVSQYWSSDEVDFIRGEAKDYYKKIQQYECCYCRHTITIKHSGVWDIEHIVSRSENVGFMFNPKNLCVACKDCNGIKSDTKVLVNPAAKHYPTRSDSFRIVHAHLDPYEIHIDNFRGRIYLPKSRKGEFTIATCRLNRFYYEELGYDPLVENDDYIMLLAERLAKSTPAERPLIKAQLFIYLTTDMRALGVSLQKDAGTNSLPKTIASETVND
jgi:hypothetical protein